MANKKGVEHRDLRDFYIAYEANPDAYPILGRLAGNPLRKAITAALKEAKKKPISVPTINRAFTSTVPTKSADLIRFALGKLFPTQCPQFVCGESESISVNVLIDKFVNNIHPDSTASDQTLIDSEGHYICVRPPPDTIYKGEEWTREKETVVAKLFISRMSDCIGTFDFVLSDDQGTREASGTVIARLPFLYLMGYCKEGKDVCFFTFERDKTDGTLRGMQLYVHKDYPTEQNTSLISRPFAAIPIGSDLSVTASVENWIRKKGPTTAGSNQIDGLVIPFRLSQSSSQLN